MTWFIFVTAFAAGLLIGSFINVVIYRGPAVFGLAENESAARGNLVTPRSYCPACKNQLRSWDLIPLLSYILLAGKCRDCGAPIPLRYPLVEMLGGAAALASVILFGPSIDAGLASLFLFTLIALAFIDHETGYLPDALTLPLVVAGLAANVTGRFVPLADAAIGAVAGFLAFWLLAAAYRALRGREGLGGGDAKLLAALGAWSGWTMLAPTVFVASVSALAFVAAGALTGRKIDGATPIRFGPALCAGGAVVLLFIREFGEFL